jgi:hypothetical protein
MNEQAIGPLDLPITPDFAVPDEYYSSPSPFSWLSALRWGVGTMGWLADIGLCYVHTAATVENPAPLTATAAGMTGLASIALAVAGIKSLRRS